MTTWRLISREFYSLLIALALTLIILIGAILAPIMNAREIVSALGGFVLLAVALSPGTPATMRIAFTIAALIAFGVGGWLDFEGWRLEWLKPSPHYLGLPRP